jgi:hypothetical protein
LQELGGIESPDSGIPFQLRTGVNAGRFLSKRVLRADIRWRAQVHVHATFAIKGQRLAAMRTLHRKSSRNRFRHARGHQLVIQLQTIDNEVRRKIQITIVDLYFGRDICRTERLDDIGGAIRIRIAQSKQRAVGGRLSKHFDFHTK